MSPQGDTREKPGTSSDPQLQVNASGANLCPVLNSRLHLLQKICQRLRRADWLREAEKRMCRMKVMGCHPRASVDFRRSLSFFSES